MKFSFTQYANLMNPIPTPGNVRRQRLRHHDQIRSTFVKWNLPIHPQGHLQESSNRIFYLSVFLSLSRFPCLLLYRKLRYPIRLGVTEYNNIAHSFRTHVRLVFENVYNVWCTITNSNPTAHWIELAGIGFGSLKLWISEKEAERNPVYIWNRGSVQQYGSDDDD